jgi:hypothetical protein
LKEEAVNVKVFRCSYNESMIRTIVQKIIVSHPNKNLLLIVVSPTQKYNTLIPPIDTLPKLKKKRFLSKSFHTLAVRMMTNTELTNMMDNNHPMEHSTLMMIKMYQVSLMTKKNALIVFTIFTVKDEVGFQLFNRMNSILNTIKL